MRRWAGPLIAGLIVGGVALILVLNLDPGPSPGKPGLAASLPQPGPVEAPRPSATPAFREYPIGEEYLDPARHIRIAAVWLPSVEWDGAHAVSGTDVIHLEADVKATEDNPNGFSKGEFVPYLAISYRIDPPDGGEALSGDLMPMVAKDGLHYGASVLLPRPGRYRLTYSVRPPSGVLGRHSDPATGVAPWWAPFTASYDWDYAPPAADREPKS